MRLIITIFFVSLITFFAVQGFMPVHAAILESVQPLGPGGTPVPNKNIANEIAELNLINADKTSPTLGVPEIVGRMLGRVMLVLGSVSLIIFMYAGVTWMLAIGQGKGESAKKALKIITWAVIGLIAIFISYIVINYVLRFFYESGGTPVF